MKTKILSTCLLGFLSIWLLFQSCNTTTGDDFLKDESVSQAYKDQLIDRKTVEVLENGYLSNNYAVLSNYRVSKGLPGEEARKIIYPIEVLQGYVQYVKNQAGNNVFIGVNLGQYPKETVIDERQNINFKGHQTMFLMTYKSSEGPEGEVFSEINGTPAMNHGSTFPPLDPQSQTPITNRNYSDYLISAPAAKILYDTYTLNNEKILNENGIEVQRQYFYKINVLESYLEYAKKEAAKSGVSEINVAINIGQYPFGGAITTGKGKQNKGKQCIYFTVVPDKYNIAGKAGNSLKEIPALVGYSTK